MKTAKAKTGKKITPEIQETRRKRREERVRRKSTNYESGAYWQDRMDLLYYQYLDYIMRTVGRDATSMIDVGTASCPYLEWFDWIPERFSFDQAPPYSSETVEGIQGDFFTHDFGRRFDVATCLQVLEHVPDAKAFTRRLLDISDLTIISVPYMWPEHLLETHVHDPVSLEKVIAWAGRKPNYHVIVEEPFRKPRRMIAVFDNTGRGRGWGKKDFKKRLLRSTEKAPTLARDPEA